ncbi:MAG TPA: TRAP transporter small permease [Dissulfurispiraceae bacterium]|nr:TRAP transporter small permease [Dissulfurispiraceae bacterium]
MRFWEEFEEIVGALLLAFMAILAFANIIARYLLEYSFAFTEEIEVALLVWLTMLGAAAGFRRTLHLGFNFLSERFPPHAQKLLAVMSAVLAVVCFCVLAWFGILQINEEQLLGITTEALGIQQYWYTLALPVGVCLIVIRIIEATTAMFRRARG